MTHKNKIWTKGSPHGQTTGATAIQRFDAAFITVP